MNFQSKSLLPPYTISVTQTSGSRRTVSAAKTGRILVRTAGYMQKRPGDALQKQKKSSGNVTKLQKEEMIMASRSSNRAAVPEAKSALDKFKYEVANELGVPLSDGYNGDLTSKQNGSVGGYMVKKMIEQQEKQMAGK